MVHFKKQLAFQNFEPFIAVSVLRVAVFLLAWVDPVRSVRRKNLKLKFKMNKKLLPTLYAIAYKIIKSLKTSILSKLLNSNTLYTIILLI